MRSICAGALLVSVLAFVATGCMTTYYKHEPSPYTVTTGGYTGPKGDITPVNRNALEAVLQSDATNLPLYYSVLGKYVEGGKVKRASMLTAQHIAAAVKDLNLMNAKLKVFKMEPEVPAGASEEEAFALWAKAYARAAARVIATPAQAAIRKEGYAAINWGYKGNRTTKQLSIIANLVVLTAHKAEKQIRVYSSDPDKAFAKLEPHAFDVSALGDDVWNPASKITVEDALAKIKDENGNPIGGAAAPTEAAPAGDEAAPAEGEAAPAEGEAAPAEGEAAPAEGEAAPAEGGE